MRKPLLLTVLPDCDAHPAECELVVVLVTPDDEDKDDSNLSPCLMSHKDLEQCSWVGVAQTNKQ